MALILDLIDKQDTFEIVRDKIAAIIATEIANQVVLAAAKPDPQEWNLRMFSERTLPWEQFENEPENVLPIVNIWYDTSTFDRGSSNISERQLSETIYNIDFFGYGQAADDGGGGQSVGDQNAALTVQRALRLVRNILMSAQYTFLDLQGVVWSRWIQSITQFQPTLEELPVQNVIAIRMAFAVGFNEFAPQIALEVLEELEVCIKRLDTGEIVTTEFDFT